MGVLPWALGFLALAALAREFWLHMILPGWAQVLHARGHRDRARELLEHVIAAPSLFGERSRVDERYRLAWFYMAEGRYADAAGVCRKILARKLPGPVESNIRLRLADCLEGAGDAEAAGEERERARECLNGVAAGAEWHLSRGRLMDDHRRYDEACEAYSTGLALIPDWNNYARAETMVRLALASFNAGRPGDTVRWAEAALEARPTEDLAMTAHSTAGIGYGSLGMLEECEGHRREAYRLAEASGNRASAARFLAQLAGVQMKRGRLMDAIRACEKAAGMSPETRRAARSCESECLRLLGRFDQARTAAEQARRAPGFPQPAAERRSQATLALGQAWLEAEAGRPDAAMAYLEEAVQELGGEEKLRLWCDATAAWILAAQGRAEEARAKDAEAEAGAARFAGDTSTQELCWGLLGRARYLLGDHAEAEAAWTRFLELPATPVFQPQAYYFRGESRAAQGRLAPALEDFRCGTSGPGESRYARLAQRRLEELQGT